MTSAPKEITILRDGLIRLKFPASNNKLLEFVRNNYPRECYVWKLEDYSGISSTSFSHTSWYFEQGETMQSFLGQLKEEWDFKFVEE